MNSRSAHHTSDRALWTALREVDDPEWPVNVVDLGLVRRLSRRGRRIDVEVTFTSVGCPFVDTVVDDIRTRLLREPDVDDVVVDVTWADWTSDDLTPAGRERLRRLGVAS